MSGKGRIIEFPLTSDKRLEGAIEKFQGSSEVKSLITEFTDLVDKGCLESWYYLGCLYEDGGDGLEPDLEKAIWYYRKSADDARYLEGVLAMGRINFYGIGVDRDLDESFSYYIDAYEYRKDTVATFMLGRIYQDDAFEGKDLRRAEQCYMEAIKHGFVYGYIFLSFLEKERRRWVRSVYYRLKAGIKAYSIARKDARDIRLRPA